MLIWKRCPNLELVSRSTLIAPKQRNRIMLVERGVRVMNMGVVGDAYAIASNYLRRTGAIPDNLVTEERLLSIIVEMFQRGEVSKLKLANYAIAKFEALENV